MPIVRLSRDKRGIDTVYLLETSADGRRAGSTRLLYFWTAPPALRVGRDPFDEARRRDLERAHPEVVFNWQELQRALDQARLMAPPAGVDARRESWRTARGPRARARSADAAAGSAEIETVEAEARPVEARAPAGADAGDSGPTNPADSSSDTAAPPAGRARRRRRRARRPAAADGSSSSADL